MKSRIIFALLVMVLAHDAIAATDENFPARKALIVNSCPYVALSSFTYSNSYAGGDRFEQRLNWKNTGTQPLVAFEIVILKYDPFDRRVIGSRWTITGKNSADWSPLEPGEYSSDGTRSYGHEEVFTAITYVRAARLQDGTVWHVDPVALAAQLSTVAPDMKQFGSLEPDPEPPPKAQKP